MSNHSQFASEDVARLCAANGLDNLEDAFRVGELLGEQHLQLATRHQNKHVVKFDMQGPAGTTRVYIKRQWRREKWLPRPTDIRHRINLLCSPVHEWRGLRILQSIGVNVSEPLAIFWSGWGLARGAVVTRAVPPTSSMVDMLREGHIQAMHPELRRSLLDAAVDVVVRLQRARISWRSMKAKHFYPEELANGEWRIWLIDCEGVYRWASRRDRRREWQTYMASVTSRLPSLRNELIAAYDAALAGRTASLKRCA